MTQEAAKPAGPEALPPPEESAPDAPPPEAEWWDRKLLATGSYAADVPLDEAGNPSGTPQFKVRLRLLVLRWLLAKRCTTAQGNQASTTLDGNRRHTASNPDKHMENCLPSLRCAHSLQLLATRHVQQAAKVTHLIEHPVPLEPPAEGPPPPPQPLKLTKRELKKLRTQRRQAREKEKQELIRQGLLEAPKPKVRTYDAHIRLRHIFECVVLELYRFTCGAFKKFACF